MRLRDLSLLLAGLPLLGLSLGCGSQGGFPEAIPCVAPSPTLTPRSTSAGSNDSLFRRHTNDGFARIEAANQTFRITWPSDAPSNRQPFREAFVAYSSQMGCLANDLKALEPKGANYAEYNFAYDAAMDEVIEINEFGVEAVRTRNTSEYREWIKKIESLPAKFDQVETLLPAGGSGR